MKIRMCEFLMYRNPLISAPPETPTSLTVKSGCNNHRPHVEWRVGESNEDIMKYVAMEFSSTYPDDINTWYKAGIVQGESANQFEFGSRLTPMTVPGNAEIRFRVIAVNQVGASTPSAPSPGSLCVTPPKRPSTNPQNVTLVAKSASQADVMWNVSNGHDFSFIIAFL